MIHTLKQEAKRLGVSSSTLSEAVKKGRQCAGVDVVSRARFDAASGRCVGFVPAPSAVYRAARSGGVVQQLLTREELDAGRDRDLSNRGPDLVESAAAGLYRTYRAAAESDVLRRGSLRKWEDLPVGVQRAWAEVAAAVIVTADTVHSSFSENPVREDRALRRDIDEVIQAIKDPESGRQSRERSLAVTKLQEAVMWLGMDLKALKEEGHDAGPNPYPDSYDPESDAPVAPTADGLTL